MKFAAVVLLSILISSSVLAQEKISMVLGTVGTPSARMNFVEGQLDEEKPGWFPELSYKVGEACGVDVSFVFMPWSRVLEMVKRGAIAAGFNSSFKKDRAVYGVYPTNDGVLDEGRASKNYSYYAYIANKSQDIKLINEADIQGRNVAVELGSAIISTLEERQAKINKISSYMKMLRLVVKGRVDAAIGAEYNFDEILGRNPSLSSMIRKSKKPIEKKIGYVMFSKKYYAKYKDQVECYWDKAAELRKTNWFKNMKASYENNK